jgi:hypothetical protein
MIFSADCRSAVKTFAGEVGQEQRPSTAVLPPPINTISLPRVQVAQADTPNP